MFRRWLVLVVLCALAPTSVLASGLGSWTLVARMHQTRAGLGTASTGGRIYALGGGNYKVGVLASVEVFNPTTNHWRVVASLPAPRANLCGVGLGGKVYAFGGDPGPVADALIYTPSSNSWAAAQPMPGSVEAGACSRDAASSHIYVFDTAHFGTAIGHVYKFNPKLNIWVTMASTVPTQRSSGSAVLGPDGKIYIAGGDSQAVDIYDPSTDSWSVGVPAPAGTRCEASLGPDGRLYVASGVPYGAAYSFITRTWSPITRAPSACSGQIGMAGGNLYYFGGMLPGSGGATAETFRFMP